ncbi:MAG: hypothetical protein WCO56_21545 [Verrucomicrobiota bacterium]
MTSREKLVLGYEIAFFPPRLNQLWGGWRHGTMAVAPDVGEALDIAQALHLALPEAGYSSQRALKRLAMYQADARAFGMPRFIRAVRQHLGRPPITDREVPPHYVRDIALPAFTRPPAA